MKEEVEGDELDGRERWADGWVWRRVEVSDGLCIDESASGDGEENGGRLTEITLARKTRQRAGLGGSLLDSSSRGKDLSLHL